MASKARSSGQALRSFLLVVIAPVTLGSIVALRYSAPLATVAVPAIFFGVVGATAPALYIASAAAGTAPSLGAMMRSLGVAIGAFGVALAGLVLPAAFLTFTSVGERTTIVVTSSALAGAAGLALYRLYAELGRPGLGIFGTWALAACAIGGRLWWEVVS